MGKVRDSEVCVGDFMVVLGLLYAMLPKRSNVPGGR